MAIEWATTGHMLNSGPATAPRPASTVILLRDGAEGPELLLVRRNPAQRVMGGFWVFPGGTVDADEGEGDASHRAAGVRELREEAGVTGVDPAGLVLFSRWITPELLAVRFDTRFFLARAPAGVRARPDGVECVEARWLSPRAALFAHERGELPLVLPTHRHFEQLSAFATTDDLVSYAHAHERDVQPVLPRVVLNAAGSQIFMPMAPDGDST